MRSLIWFRNDLRVVDNPALAAALRNGDTVACVCLCQSEWRERHHMSDWRLALVLRSIQELQADLARLNVPLRILPTPWFADVPGALAQLCGELGVTQLHATAEYPLDERRRDVAVEQALTAAGVDFERHHADVLVRPGRLLTGKGAPYTVFTPFYRQWRAGLEERLPALLPRPAAQRRMSLGSDPVPQVLDGVSADFGSEAWPGGARQGSAVLESFATGPIGNYLDRRDLPAVAGTSRLSPYLALGNISVLQCAHAALQMANDPSAREGAETWLKELAWRDFYRHIVAQFDHVSQGFAFKREMDALVWRSAPEEFAAWQQGRTGYALVDAGMRQLLETGWMHNRVRMVTAMFLTKHLLIDWRLGERYFMQHLVDGDFASNNGGWQWSASTGTDAAPYFRIFNPARQAERFDPDGTYRRRWLGDEALPPIVEHSFARQRALDFFAR